MNQTTEVDVNVQLGTGYSQASARFLKTAKTLSIRFENSLILKRARGLDLILKDSSHSWEHRVQRATNGALDSLVKVIGKDTGTGFIPLWNDYGDVLVRAKAQLRVENEMFERRRKEARTNIKTETAGRLSVRGMFDSYDSAIGLLYAPIKNSRAETILNEEIRNSLLNLSEVLQGKYESNNKKKVIWKWEDRLSESQKLLKFLENMTRKAQSTGNISREKAEQIYDDARMALEIGINNNPYLKENMEILLNGLTMLVFII